jgi:arylsulfatase A-like enzyme
VPLIWRHPSRIKAGTTIDRIVTNYDFLPTLLDYLGLASRTPSMPRLPGRNYKAFLDGQEARWEDIAYYEYEFTRAVRTEKWKYVARYPDGVGELYDMESDPNERFNLFGQRGTATVQAQLAGQLQTFFGQFADPQYDLWRGGRSKARVHSLR